MSAIDAVTAAIKAFDFEDYGLHEVDPTSEYAEWVPVLAAAVHAACRPAVLAEAKIETVAWLVKKAAEQPTWNAGVLASKVDRGAVRAFIGTGHYRDAMDAHRAKVLTEAADLLEFLGMDDASAQLRYQATPYTDDTAYASTRGEPGDGDEPEPSPDHGDQAGMTVAGLLDLLAGGSAGVTRRTEYALLLTADETHTPYPIAARDHQEAALVAADSPGARIVQRTVTTTTTEWAKPGDGA
ncbi:hypothetical protein OG900_33620 [Streptomyces sp. NBC_00433]